MNRVGAARQTGEPSVRDGIGLGRNGRKDEDARTLVRLRP